MPCHPQGLELFLSIVLFCCYFTQDFSLHHHSFLGICEGCPFNFNTSMSHGQEECLSLPIIFMVQPQNKPHSPWCWLSHQCLLSHLIQYTHWINRGNAPIFNKASLAISESPARLPIAHTHLYDDDDDVSLLAMRTMEDANSIVDFI